MNATAGIVLLIVFAAMLWFGKPRNGVQLRFMRSWILGIGYTMVCMLTFVLGVVSIIFSLR